MNETYYVYAHQRKSDGKCFYIGKGTRRRAWQTTGRNSHWNRMVAKHGYCVEILMDNLTEEAAFELETFLIEEIGRENLCNKTNGGEGSSGYKHTAEYRAALKGRPAHNKGKPMSAEHRAKLGAAKKGKIMSAEHRAKLSAAAKGKPKSAEHIAKREATRKANKLKNQTS